MKVKQELYLFVVNSFCPRKKEKVDHRKSHFYPALVRLLEGAECEKEAKNLVIYKK